ncbi:MAG: aminoglycoside phosphotransferase family protein [Verrucomicrobia bacterium]|nr:aminoglycoside phosphotransferase family protein [Verrucomicrobiota bacterium]
MDTKKAQHDLRSIAGLFHIYGDFVEAAPYGTGHINDTYSAVFNQSGSPARYIFQRINHHVFKNPSAVMENVSRVTAHLREKLEQSGADQISRRVLTLVPTHDGRTWDMDAEGNHWRCYLFIEKATTYDQIETTQQAFQAAKAFGAFQKMLADLPAPRLRDTIPNFHHTRSRFDALRQAMQEDTCNRAASVRDEIEFCLERERMVDVLLGLQARGLVPERVTHNDTKLDNVMIDDATGEGICVIDLDTVMPGLVLYDFGDLCRTGCRPTAEDERDLAKVEMRLEMFEALVRGYLASAGDFLNAAEKDHLVFSARLITFEIGLRFLTDYLQGDRYFKIHRDGHNADRARVQFKMVESFERNEAAMSRVVQEAGAGTPHSRE